MKIVEQNHLHLKRQEQRKNGKSFFKLRNSFFLIKQHLNSIRGILEGAFVLVTNREALGSLRPLCSLRIQLALGSTPPGTAGKAQGWPQPWPINPCVQHCEHHLILIQPQVFAQKRHLPKCFGDSAIDKGLVAPIAWMRPGTWDSSPGCPVSSMVQVRLCKSLGPSCHRPKEWVHEIIENFLLPFSSETFKTKHKTFKMLQSTILQSSVLQSSIIIAMDFKTQWEAFFQHQIITI